MPLERTPKLTVNGINGVTGKYDVAQRVIGRAGGPAAPVAQTPPASAPSEPIADVV